MTITDQNQDQQKRNFLLFSPVCPAPSGIGVEQRAWSHLEALSRLGNVDLVLTMTSAQLDRLGDTTEAAKLCRTVRTIALTPSPKLAPRNVPGLTLAVRLAMLNSPTYTVSHGAGNELIASWPSDSYDLAFCFRIRTYPILQELRREAKLIARSVFVDFDDIESITLERELPFLRTKIGRENSVISRIDRIETKELERRIQKEADVVSVCSELDRQKLKARGGRASLAVIPNSFPCTSALPLPPEGKVPSILFLGTMGYLPNEDAVIYFCTSIYPIIRRALDNNVTLTIVGRRPRKQVLALNGENGIVVTGGVENVEPYYGAADLVVAPIRFGGGTRIKILEALSYGRPIVSTTIGAEGLDLVNNRDLIIADTPHHFSTECIDLISDRDRRASIASAGRKRVLELYSRDSTQRTTISAVCTAIENATSPCLLTAKIFSS